MFGIRLKEGFVLVRYEVSDQPQPCRIAGVYVPAYNRTIRRWLTAAAADVVSRSQRHVWQTGPRRQWELRATLHDGLLRFTVQPATDEPGWVQRFVARGPVLPARRIARALIDRCGREMVGS